MSNFDQELVKAFTSFGKSVDRIACFLPLRERFLATLDPTYHGMSHEEIIWRLMQLRKQGSLSVTR